MGGSAGDAAAAAAAAPAPGLLAACKAPSPSSRSGAPKFEYARLRPSRSVKSRGGGTSGEPGKGAAGRDMVQGSSADTGSMRSGRGQRRLTRTAPAATMQSLLRPLTSSLTTGCHISAHFCQALPYKLHQRIKHYCWSHFSGISIVAAASQPLHPAPQPPHTNSRRPHCA